MIGEYRYQAGDLALVASGVTAGTGHDPLDAAVRATPAAQKLIEGGLFKTVSERGDRENSRDRFAPLFDMLCDARPELADDPAAVAVFKLLGGYGAKIGAKVYVATTYGNHGTSRVYLGPARYGSGLASRDHRSAFDTFGPFAARVVELVRMAQLRAARKERQKLALDAAKAAFENPLVAGTVLYEHFGIPRYFRVLKVTPMGCTVRQLQYAEQIAFESDLSPGTEFVAGAPEVRARYAFRVTPGGSVTVALKLGRRQRLYIWDGGA